MDHTVGTSHNSDTRAARKARARVAVERTVRAAPAGMRSAADGFDHGVAPKVVKAMRALSTAERGVLERIARGDVPVHEAIASLVQLVHAGKMSREDAILRVDADSLMRVHRPQFATEPTEPPLTQGLGVSNGCASGTAVFDAVRAAELASQGAHVVLLVDEIAPNEVDSMAKVQGVICTRGTYSSHTSVLARDYGIPAVNDDQVIIDRATRTATIGDVVIHEGDAISVRVDGRESAEIFRGAPSIVTRANDPAFRELLAWCVAKQGIGVKANADLPGAVARAIEFGASGVGLVRTEHMFFGDRRKTLQSAILALNESEQRSKLEQLAAFQVSDFEKIFENARGAAVQVRLMDPPLDEFLPRDDAEQTRLDVNTLADRLGMDVAAVKSKLLENPLFERYTKLDFERLFLVARQEPAEMVALAKEMDLAPEFVRQLAQSLHETNPMMGMRGVRLSVAKPQIYEMQVRAMLEAAGRLVAQGKPVDLRIIVPMVIGPEEIVHVRHIIDRVGSAVEARSGVKVPHKVIAMIETPAAALRAHEIADVTDGFCFGTNDLTQFTLALSRGDAGSVLDAYRKDGLLAEDPFQKIDPKTVGKLISVAIYYARHCATEEKPTFPAGICGEQGAEPSTIALARNWGVDYVSVSPHRVATAILASAQENIGRAAPKTPALSALDVRMQQALLAQEANH
jgi:pyruvate,orthophosphate dikinase